MASGPCTSHRRERSSITCWSAAPKSTPATSTITPRRRSMPTVGRRSAAPHVRNLPALRVMLDAGFPIDAVNDEGMSSLQRSSLRGFVDVVEFLSRRGASLTHHHSYGGDAVDTCIWGSLNFKDREGDYP